MSQKSIGEGTCHNLVEFQQIRYFFLSVLAFVVVEKMQDVFMVVDESFTKIRGQGFFPSFHKLLFH